MAQGMTPGRPTWGAPLNGRYQTTFDPGWAAAEAWTGDRLFEARVRAVLDQDAKQRDSVKTTDTRVLAACLLTAQTDRPLPVLELSFFDDCEPRCTCSPSLMARWPRRQGPKAGPCVDILRAGRSAEQPGDLVERDAGWCAVLLRCGAAAAAAVSGGRCGENWVPITQIACG